MKSYAFYSSTIKPEEQQLLIKFARQVGAEPLGTTTYQKCDVAIIFGSWKKQSRKEWKADRNPHHKLKNDIIDNHRGPVVIFETPLLNRKITQNHTHYRVGLNHFMRGLSDFKNEQSSPDRFNSMGIDIKPWRKKGDHVLLVGQNLHDASLFGLNFEWWIENTLRHLMKNTDRPIVVRDHPENKNLLEKLIKDKFGYTDQISYDTNPKIGQSLKNAWCTVSYTSGSSIDSVLAGVPVITCSEYNFMWPISSHSIEDIETPKLGSRQQLFYDLAWAQWSVDEILQGKPWEHLVEN
jgi:hypothetical protein